MISFFRKTIITGGINFLLILFLFPLLSVNAQNPKLVLPIGHYGAIDDAAFSPDGKKIVTASDDYLAKIWDAASGLLLADLKVHEHKITMVRFSSAGDRIVTASYDKTAAIWDATTGALLLSLSPHTEAVTSAQFLPGDDKVLTTSNDEALWLWDATNGNLLKQWPGLGGECPAISRDGLKIVGTHYDTAFIYEISSGKTIPLIGHTDGITAVSFDPQENFILTGAFDSTARIWDANTGRQLKRFFTKGAVQTAFFSHGGDRIVTAAHSGHAICFDLKSNKIKFVLQPEGGYLLSARFSPNDSLVLTASKAGLMSLWNSITGKLLFTLEGHIPYIYLKFGKFSPDGRYVLSGSEDKTARLWDVTTGQEVISLLGHTRIMQSIQFNEDGTRAEIKNWDDNSTEFWDLLTGSKLNDEIYRSYYSTKYEDKKLNVEWDKVEVLNLSEDSILALLEGHTSLVFSAEFNLKGDRILTTSNDHTNRLWETSSGRPLLVFFGVDSTGFFSQIPSGYYHANSETAKLLHYVTPDLKFITFEQLDIRFNRPDKVLEGLNHPDTALIRSYRQAWQKRVRRLGMDTSAFRESLRVPEADFLNRKEISYEQGTQFLPLQIQASDTAFILDRLNVWVNEVPLYGQRGLSLRERNLNHIDTNLTIALSAGVNKIEFSVTNANGLESYRSPVVVNHKTTQTKRNVHFIGMGIDRFAQSRYNLTYSTKDIRDLAKTLKKRYGTGISIDTLFNEEVSLQNISALKEKLKKTSVNDIVIVAYSGHGLLDKDFDYFLSTYSIDFEKPEFEGIPYETFESLLDSIPARQKLMLIDACHSGEVDKTDVEQLNVTTPDGAKGLKPVAYKKEGQLGLKNSFELMQSLFVNVSKSTGTVVISAAAGTEFALEGAGVPNGVFTHAILESLKSFPSIKVSELRKKVTARVTELTNGLQKPTGRNEMISVDWSL